MSNSRPIMDELDIMMHQDDLISSQMEEIDEQIKAQLKTIDCPMTNDLEEYEEIDYSTITEIEPIEDVMQDVVDDEVNEIIDADDDIFQDEDGMMIDRLAGID